MCIILDTNTFSRFRDPNDEDMQLVRKWLDNRNGKIAYSSTEKFEEEWNKGGMKHLRDQMRQAGKLKLVPQDAVEQKENEIKGKMRSNDEHIIALALIARVKVLVSYREGDEDLFADFKNRELVRGKVYTRKAHAQRMLTKDTCP